MELGAHPRPLGLGQMVDDVLLFVDSAARDRGVVGEHVADRLGERLGAVEDEQDALRGVEAAVA